MVYWNYGTEAAVFISVTSSCQIHIDYGLTDILYVYCRFYVFCFLSIGENSQSVKLETNETKILQSRRDILRDLI